MPEQGRDRLQTMQLVHLAGTKKQILFFDSNNNIAVPRSIGFFAGHTKLLRRMQNSSSAQVRLKNMLHALKQVNGSEVLVIQDDLDITCGIVLQTRLQKVVLKQWGENLSLDFTHGTNNLGFNLGKLGNGIHQNYKATLRSKVLKQRYLAGYKKNAL
ncbi:Serine protease family S01A [Phytophthora palmivora]|uniref:Serine protease family S01A n=1 Tax=Phytophthora palmivora TaxID=4796 RepID=A0A2P4XZN2_9STRA|nr:Serine protease family S01A [Phytophthora palmivora]